MATCAADTEAIRIPTQDYVARVCLTELHRRCEVFRSFLGVRLAEPEDSRDGARGGVGKNLKPKTKA